MQQAVGSWPPLMAVMPLTVHDPEVFRNHETQRIHYFLRPRSRETGASCSFLCVSGVPAPVLKGDIWLHGMPF
jgi:hypothetical protein